MGMGKGYWGATVRTGEDGDYNWNNCRNSHII